MSTPVKPVEGREGARGGGVAYLSSSPIGTDSSHSFSFINKIYLCTLLLRPNDHVVFFIINTKNNVKQQVTAKTKKLLNEEMIPAFCVMFKVKEQLTKNMQVFTEHNGETCFYKRHLLSPASHF